MLLRLGSRGARSSLRKCESLHLAFGNCILLQPQGMAQRSITAFFQTNGQPKEKKRESAPSSNSTKRTKVREDASDIVHSIDYLSLPDTDGIDTDSKFLGSLDKLLWTPLL